MDIHGIALDKAELIATILEGTLYGFSLLMYAVTVCVLLSRWGSHPVSRMMLVLACLFLLCSTTHLVIDVIRIMEALIMYRDTYPGGPVAFLSDVSQWTFVSKNYVYTIQTLIGDGVILYRCYAVWQSILVMIVPICLWCSAGVVGIGAAVHASQNPDFDEALIRWITAFYAITFTSNMLTTLLLAFRIWYIDRQSKKLRGHQKSQLRQVLHIVIDAGALYNLTLVVVWICFSVQTSGQFVVLDMIMPIISITFYMVIIRVGLTIQANRSTNIFPLRGSYSGNSFSDPRHGLQVRINTLTENKVEDSNQRPSMSPLTVIDIENRPPRGGVKLDDAKEVV